MQKKYIYVTVAVAYAGLIFYLSSLPSPPNPFTPTLFMKLHRMLMDLGIEFLAYPFYFAYRYPDKFTHMLLYMGFGFTLNPAVRNTVGKNPEIVSLALGTIYGASDEFHQSFVPYRSPSVADLMADFVGLLLSQILIVAIMRVRSRQTG
jgi:VanZ family protein